jgi:CheY-like chemotaxis protein
MRSWHGCRCDQIRCLSHGYELAAALRAAGLDRAMLVAVTGYGHVEDLRRSREHGLDHHLVKPVDLAALRQITGAHHRA